MTIKHTGTNRIDRICRATEAREWGQLSAMHGEPESTCPYVVGSYLWCLWFDHRERMLAKLVDQEAEDHERDFAERCERDGDSGGQRGWWAWCKELLFGASDA